MYEQDRTKSSQDLFRQFEGDLTSLAVLAYLCTTFGDNLSQLVSLSELSRKTGYGRPKLQKILSRLNKMGFIEHEISSSRGVLVTLAPHKPVSFSTGLYQTVPAPVSNSTDLYQTVPVPVSNSTGLTNPSPSLRCERSEHLSPHEAKRNEVEAPSLSHDLKLGTQTKAKLEPASEESLNTALDLTLELQPDPKPKKKRKARTPAKPKEKTLGSKIWEAYADEFFKVYGIEPARNAKANANCAQIGQRLGEDAIEVVRFYVHHRDRFFVLKNHPISLALSEAERLLIDWKRGTIRTHFEAQQVERKADSEAMWELIKDL